MKRRTSLVLERMKSELRYYAIREKDEEIANRYWRLYYRAINVEHEFREIVLETEVSRLIDIIIAEGLVGQLHQNETICNKTRK
jgi:hypothetical protein